MKKFWTIFIQTKKKSNFISQPSMAILTIEIPSRVDMKYVVFENV